MMRLFGVEMTPNEKPKETKRGKKRRSTMIFGRDLVPERRRSAIKKTRTSSPPLPPAPFPFPLLQMIHNMEGRDQVFVTRKILERSDVDAGQNRFFVPKSEVLWGVLSEEEKREVEGGGGVEVMVVDPRGGKYTMRLKKWVSLNKVVLNSGWRKLVEDNGLKAEVDCVELWSFRADSKLCFALNVKRDGSLSQSSTHLQITVEGGGGVEVMVVDPRGGKHDMRLKKWVSLNKIVLNSGWRKLVDGNDLKAELDCVELWSFRADSKLCFALNVKRQVQ